VGVGGRFDEMADIFFTDTFNNAVNKVNECTGAGIDHIGLGQHVQPEGGLSQRFFEDCPGRHKQLAKIVDSVPPCVDEIGPGAEDGQQGAFHRVCHCPVDVSHRIFYTIANSSIETLDRSAVSLLTPKEKLGENNA
jgi:hypothetical protein